MLKVVFRNLAKSEFMKDIIDEKVGHVLEKFPDLVNSATTVVVGMQNTPMHAGPELFRIKLILKSRGLKPIVLEKHSDNAYQAAAMLADRLFEVLHRAIERRREKLRLQRKKWKHSDGAPFDWSK